MRFTLQRKGSPTVKIAIVRWLTWIVVAAAFVLVASLPVSAQPKEVVIGVLYPLPKWLDRK